MLLLSPIIFMMHSMPVQAIDPKLSTDKFDRITNEIYIYIYIYIYGKSENLIQKSLEVKVVFTFQK
jgi:hypothetical protein